MRNTGIVRNLDNLGRIVIPNEMRKVLEIKEKDPLEIIIEDDHIVLRKYKPSDIFNGETSDLIDYEGKLVSKKTIEDMAKIIGLIE